MTVGSEPPLQEEGIVVKSLSSKWVPNDRHSGAWLKVGRHPRRKLHVCSSLLHQSRRVFMERHHFFRTNGFLHSPHPEIVHAIDARNMQRLSICISRTFSADQTRLRQPAGHRCAHHRRILRNRAPRRQDCRVPAGHRSSKPSLTGCLSPFQVFHKGTVFFSTTLPFIASVSVKAEAVFSAVSFSFKLLDFKFS
jgi:hypothetical protein